jgi:hypothetical protein
MQSQGDRVTLVFQTRSLVSSPFQDALLSEIANGTDDLMMTEREIS